MVVPRIDHLVLGVINLEQAESDFRHCGFDVLDRGDAAGPMQNRLVRFADGSFLELLAFSGDSTHRFAPRWMKGSGWIDFALNASDFSRQTEALRSETGRELPRRSLSKPAPNVGKSWELDLIEPGVGAFDPVLPFLIEEKTPTEWRLPPLGDDIRQPHGISAVRGVTCVTDDLERSKTLMSAVFGRPAAIASRHGAGTIAVLFEEEKIWVELVQPINSATAIGTHIQKYGTGLYEATLLGNEAIESLPVAARHRAKLRVSSVDGFPFH
ncbi:VOC family protein [Oryzicola mucosus]|uniref:VOC family protein n=1 Tax=Oryzicola mucosus TaxID=2767425 RepID=A0A8J6U615_9HYPH|nr:VOC family protein [Oryzicola mucosus]MBD0417400.1 VOC family protein [Oryzicola mucosus]